MRIEIKVPSAGESVTEADMASWHVKEGDTVEADQAIADIETEKASMTIVAEKAGTIHLKAQEGQAVKVGEVIGTIDTDKVKSVKKTPSEDHKEASPSKEDLQERSEETSYTKGLASPAARKRLEETQIDSHEVTATGKGGRLTKQDVLKYEESKSLHPTAHGASYERREERKKMTRLRKTIATRLSEVQNEAALLTTFNEIDMSAVMHVRNLYKERFHKRYGVKLGYMSFFTKAVCHGLRAIPVLNAFIEGDDMVFHHYCDIGIAVSTPKGLVVPIIRNAERMTFDLLERAISELATKGREGALTLEEMTGGTFTITNGGLFGSMLSTPIVNRPQSAILGMHNIVERPVVKAGQIEIAPVMYVALTYDHRLIDGAEAVRFLVSLKEQLEDPMRLILDV